jgi:hypothetical protein
MSDAFLHGELLWLQIDDAVRATCCNFQQLRQSKNHTLAFENRRHIVLIHSSLLSVRNCDAARLAISFLASHCVSKNPAESLRNSLLPEAFSRLTVTEPILAKHGM